MFVHRRKQIEHIFEISVFYGKISNLFCQVFGKIPVTRGHDRRGRGQNARLAGFARFASAPIRPAQALPAMPLVAIICRHDPDPADPRAGRG